MSVQCVVSHGLTISEKAASGAYVDRAFIVYDNSVCGRAKKIGLTAFMEPVNEDLIRHFSRENSHKFDQHQGSVKKGKNICFRYNSEPGCQSKDCRYIYKCSNCKGDGHSSKDCHMPAKSK